MICELKISVLKDGRGLSEMGVTVSGSRMLAALLSELSKAVARVIALEADPTLGAKDLPCSIV